MLAQHPHARVAHAVLDAELRERGVAEADGQQRRVLLLRGQLAAGPHSVRAGTHG